MKRPKYRINDFHISIKNSLTAVLLLSSGSLAIQAADGWRVGVTYDGDKWQGEGSYKHHGWQVGGGYDGDKWKWEVEHEPEKHHHKEKSDKEHHHHKKHHHYDLKDLPEDFDPVTYLSLYSDLQKAVADVKHKKRWAKEHYLKHGQNEGRKYK